MTEMMHDYIAEIQTRTGNDDPPTVDARKSILAENDPDAQRQAEEWAGMVVARSSGSVHLVVRHDDRIVIDRELKG